MSGTGRAPLWFALLALAATACAGSDGGPVGTGIAASVFGNVVDVEDGGEGSGAGVAGVVVSIEDEAGLEARTDEEGNFELAGDFAGRLSLRFRTEDYSVIQPVDVPGGSVLVLADIEVAPDGVTALSSRQLDLIGTLAAVDCAGGGLVVEDRSDERVPFAVQLLPETTIATAPSGAAASCADLALGRLVAVEGLVDLPSGAITALAVELDPDVSAPPPLERRVSFVGRAVALDCARSRIVIDDGRQRTRLRLRNRTDIVGPDGEELTCAGVELGDRLVGIGQLDLARPAVVQARTIKVARRGTPIPELRVVGFLATVDCASGLLEIGEADAALATVRLRPRTAFRPPELTCADLEPGQRLEVFGVPSLEVPGALDANRVRLKRRRA
jgi:hypothetical protein